MASLHDAFFRRILLDCGLCKALLQTALTKREVELFNFDTLKAELGTFIDKNLGEHKSDVIVSVQFKGSKRKAKVFFLLEHKSYKDPFVLIQMLKAEIYSGKEYRKEKTPVYPVLIYQGKKQWNFSGNFQDAELRGFPLAARKVLKKRFIDFTCSYLNLQKLNIRRKTNHSALKLALFVMKNIWIINDKIVKQVILMAKDLVQEEQDLIHDILSYITKYDKRYSHREKILELEDSVLEEEEKFMKTVLTTPWEDKAEKKGKREGRREGLEEVAARMLKEGESIQRIHKITQLPKDEIKKLKKAA